MWFGNKHKGKRIDQLPDDDVAWLLEKNEVANAGDNFRRFKELLDKWDAWLEHLHRDMDPASIKIWYGEMKGLHVMKYVRISGLWGTRVDTWKRRFLKIMKLYEEKQERMRDSGKSGQQKSKGAEMKAEDYPPDRSSHDKDDDCSEDSQSDSADDTNDVAGHDSDKSSSEVPELVENAGSKKLASARSPWTSLRTKRGRISECRSVSSDEDEDAIITPTCTPVVVKIKEEGQSTQDDADGDIRPFGSTRKRKGHIAEEGRVAFLDRPAAKRAKKSA